MMSNDSFLRFSQCAGLSFSELKLKEKEEGEEQEKGMTAAGETELADSQPRGEGRKDEEEGGAEGKRKVGGEGGRECCQQSEWRQGGEGGGGPPPEDTAEAPRGKRIYGRVCRMQTHTCVDIHTLSRTHTQHTQHTKDKAKCVYVRECVCACAYHTHI